MAQTRHWGEEIKSGDEDNLPDISKLIERSMEKFDCEEFENNAQNSGNEKIDVKDEQIHHLM